MAIYRAEIARLREMDGTAPVDLRIQSTLSLLRQALHARSAELVISSVSGVSGMGSRTITQARGGAPGHPRHHSQEPDARAAVWASGRAIGAIEVSMPQHCPLTLAEHRLLRDAAAVIGTAFERKETASALAIDISAKQVLQAMPDGVIVHDPSGTTLFINDSALRLTGTSNDRTARPMTVASFLSRIDARHEDGRRVRAGELPSMSRAGTTRSGELIASIQIGPTRERRWTVFRASTGDECGQSEGPRVCIVRDWTDQYIASGLQRVSDGIAQAVASRALDASSVVAVVGPVIESLVGARCEFRHCARELTSPACRGQHAESQWLLSSLRGMLHDRSAPLDDVPSREIERLDKPVEWDCPEGYGAFGPVRGDADRRAAPGGTRLVSVPIRQADSLLGSMTFSRPIHVPPFAETDLELMREICVRIGIALTTVRLRSELEESRSRLDRAMEQLASASDLERRRVALSIHDGLAQVAASTYQHLESLSTRYAVVEGDRIDELMWVRELARQTVREARRVIADLRPTSLEEFDLDEAIRYEIGMTRAEGWDVRFAGDFDDREWSPHIRRDVLRVIQESLSNVRKYAGQARVDVALVSTARAVHLTIADHGKGFDATTVPTSSRGSDHVGLAGIRERISLLGGTVTIQSAMGAGTTIGVTIPIAS